MEEKVRIEKEDRDKERGEGVSLYRSSSRATLIDQDTGNVYQVRLVCAGTPHLTH